MSEEKDGGPAFPHLGLYMGADGNLHPTPTQYAGLSLRDWFAAHMHDVDLSLTWAKAIMGSEPPDWMLDDGMTCVRWWAEAEARARYVRADAMLAARRDTNG